jgi:hypothetical protein
VADICVACFNFRKEDGYVGQIDLFIVVGSGSGFGRRRASRYANLE